MADFAAVNMSRRLITIGAELHMFQLRSGLLVDAGCVVLHLAFLANQIDIRVFSAWHSSEF